MTPSALLHRLLLFALLLLTFGCSQNYYNVPRETYEQKVRILGVAPLFMDAESDIRHPDRETLVSMIKDLNRKNEPELVAQLKSTGSYFAVQPIEDDADRLFSSLLFRREKREDGGIVYNKYFYKGPELKELVRKNGVDALLLMVVSGLTKRDKIRSSNLMEYLEADYNYLIISGQILDADGNTLWEYPNFKQRQLTFPTFFTVQYPDFDEARANATDKVDIKFKTIPGINRALSKGDESSLRKNATVSNAYAAIFDDMVSMLKPEFTMFGDKNKKKKEPEQGAQQATSGVAPRQQAPAAQPASPAAQAPRPILPAAPPAPQPPPVPLPPGTPPAQPISSPTLAPAN